MSHLLHVLENVHLLAKGGYIHCILEKSFTVALEHASYLHKDTIVTCAGEVPLLVGALRHAVGLLLGEARPPGEVLLLVGDLHLAG